MNKRKKFLLLMQTVFLAITCIASIISAMR